VEHRLWAKVDPVAVGESQTFDTCALVDDPVEALSILDDPGVVLIANACVQTRDTLVGHAHIGALQAPNGDQRLVEPALANDFAIEFDEDASLADFPCRRAQLALSLRPALP